MRRWWTPLAVVTMALTAVVAPGSVSAQEEASDLPPGAARQLEAALALSAELTGRMREPAREASSVSSPFMVADALGDAIPYEEEGDLTAFRIRNGPNVFTMDFWLARRPQTWNTAPTFGNVRLDGARNGLGRDFDVVIASSRQTGKFAAIGEPDFDDPSEIHCISTNVRDLGRSFLGYGYTVKIGFGCLGGRQGMSARMLFVYSENRQDPDSTTDVVPSATWTPTVRPA
jgi:hypothetical protein